MTVTNFVSHRLYESHTVVITDSVTCPVTVSASEVLQNVCKPKKSEMRKREKGKGEKVTRKKRKGEKVKKEKGSLK